MHPQQQRLWISVLIFYKQLAISDIKNASLYEEIDIDEKINVTAF